MLTEWLMGDERGKECWHQNMKGPWKRKWKSLSHVQLFETLWTVACQASLSMKFSRPWHLSLEWIAMPFSRGSAQPRDWTQVSCIMGGFFTLWATREGPLGVGKWGAFESLPSGEVTGSMLSFGKTDFIGVPSCFQLAGGCHHLLTEKPLSQKLPFICKFSDVPTDILITDLWLCSSSDLVFGLGFPRIWMLTSFIGSLFSLYSSSSAVNPALGTGHLTRPLLDLRGSLDSSVYR